MAVPSSEIGIPEASSKVYTFATESVEACDGRLHIFISRTNSEKGSSRDSMTGESLDNWENFGDGGGDNDPLEITSISSDMSKEGADGHENTSRLFCLSDVSTPEGIVIKPDTSQQQVTDALDKLGGELATELFEVKDEPLGDWRAVSDFNTQEDSDLHNMFCSQERDAHGESNGKIASEHITIKDEPLDNWEDTVDDRPLQVKEKLVDKDDQVCRTMAGLTRKAVIDRYFSSGDTFENVVSTMTKEYQQGYSSRKAMKKGHVAAFKCDFCRRWKKASYCRRRFEKINSVWLEKELKLYSEINDLKCDRPGSSDQREFNDDQSDRTKRRKSEETRKDRTADAHATQVKLRESGRLRAKDLCKKVFNRACQKDT